MKRKGRKNKKIKKGTNVKATLPLSVVGGVHVKETDEVVVVVSWWRTLCELMVCCNK